MMRTRLHALARVFLISAALAAPATAQESGAAPADRQVSLYLDSAAAVQALAALSVPELPEGVPPLFWLGFDSTGAVSMAEGVYTQLPAAFAGPVASILRAHARRQSPSDDPPGVYLRIATGPGAGISRAEVTQTAPEWLNRSFAADLIKPVLRRREEAVGRDTVRSVSVAARVLADGSVDPASVKLLGSTGDGEIDGSVAAVVHQLRFRPGSVEGIPAPFFVTVPFSLTGGIAGPHAEYMRQPVKMVPGLVPLPVLVDSAALAGALATLPAVADPERAHFRVRFDTTGAVDGVEAIHPGLPEDRALALAEVIGRHVHRQPRSPEPLHLHLRVVPGPGAQVGRSGGTAEATLTNQEAVRRRIREAPVRGVADVVFAVAADGALDPSSVEFVGSAPAPELASVASAIVGQMRFRGGFVGRLPARTWLRVFLWLGQGPEF
jgi:outer membrane biosynthesis protein TonB